MLKSCRTIAAIASLIAVPALAQDGCSTAACNAVMAQLDQMAASNVLTSSTGELHSSSRIKCEKQVRSDQKTASMEYQAAWKAIYYSANRPKGMTMHDAKAQAIKQGAYDRLWAGLAKRMQFCDTQLLNTKIAS